MKDGQEFSIFLYIVNLGLAVYIFSFNLYSVVIPSKTDSYMYIQVHW